MLKTGARGIRRGPVTRRRGVLGRRPGANAPLPGVDTPQTGGGGSDRFTDWGRSSPCLTVGSDLGGYWPSRLTLGPVTQHSSTTWHAVHQAYIVSEPTYRWLLDCYRTPRTPTTPHPTPIAWSQEPSLRFVCQLLPRVYQVVTALLDSVVYPADAPGTRPREVRRTASRARSGQTDRRGGQRKRGDSGVSATRYQRTEARAPALTRRAV